MMYILVHAALLTFSTEPSVFAMGAYDTKVECVQAMHSDVEATGARVTSSSLYEVKATQYGNKFSWKCDAVYNR